MAEASWTPSTKVLCRYFVHGVCREGSLCKFSHDRSNKMDMVCKYYLKGCCSFADKCRYDHVKQKPDFHDDHVMKSQPIFKLTPPSLKTEAPISNMVSLKKALKEDKTPTPSTPKSPEQWVQAKEFVPGQPYFSSSIPASYAHAACSSSDAGKQPAIPSEPVNSKDLLCPFSTNKECPYGEECEYTHGKVCDLCGLAVLKPDDLEQNTKHQKECMEQHERDMELSFAIAKSKDKQCGICMDMVMEKEPVSERRFGILSDCTHCFCLACIRKWRSSKQFDNKTIRSCPECRVQSDFITPSSYWVDTKEDKIKVIEGYKCALKDKPCKYFDQGRGECPFNEKCFYLHAYPDGRIASPKPRRRRRRHDANGELSSEDRTFLWDFISNRQNIFEEMLLLLEEEDLMSLIINLSTDSDDDSDNDFWDI